MWQGVPPWHTAAEMQLFSNLAHSIEGLVVGAAGVVALAEAHGGMKGRRSRYTWPALVLAAGCFLTLYLLLPYHGLALAREQWAFVFNDPQQRQHFLIGVLLTVGGAAGLAHRRYQLGWARGLIPTTLVALGVVFLVHEQHGTSAAVARALLIHQGLGGLFGIAGLTSLYVELRPTARWAATAWPIALLLAGLLLFLYREPAGAYQAEPVPAHDRH